jgi:hypothetical protein
MHTPMTESFYIAFFVVFGVMLLEMAVYYVAPGWLAKLALIPVGTARTVLLPPVVLGQGQLQAGYRATAMGSVALDRVRFPPVLSGSATVGEWSGTSGWLRLTTLWFGWNRSLGVARLRATQEGNVVRLDARLYPMPISMALLWPTLLLFPAPESMIVPIVGAFAFAITLGWYMTVRRIRDDVDGVLLEIASAIERSGR